MNAKQMYTESQNNKTILLKHELFSQFSEIL